MSTFSVFPITLTNFLLRFTWKYLNESSKIGLFTQGYLSYLPSLHYIDNFQLTLDNWWQVIFQFFQENQRKSKKIKWNNGNIHRKAIHAVQNKDRETIKYIKFVEEFFDNERKCSGIWRDDVNNAAGKKSNSKTGKQSGKNKLTSI